MVRGRPALGPPLSRRAPRRSLCGGLWSPPPRADLSIPPPSPPSGHIEVVARWIVDGFLSGLHRSPRKGFSVEFADFRPYQPGDDLRYVDWKIAARSDRWVVKQYEEETNLRATLVLDVSRSMDWRGAPAGAPHASARTRSSSWRRSRSCSCASATPSASSASTTPCAPACRRAPARRSGAASSPRSASRAAGAPPTSPRRSARPRRLVTRRGIVVLLVSDLLVDPEPALAALRGLRAAGHDVVGLPRHGSRRARLRHAGEAQYADPESALAVPAAARRRARGLRDTVARGDRGMARGARRPWAPATSSSLTDQPYARAAPPRLRRAAAAAMSFLAPLYLLLGAAPRPCRSCCTCCAATSRRAWTFPPRATSQRAEQEHSRSLRLRNLLLMLLRVLLVLALALAAARPFVAGVGVGHGPTAVAVVLDNSLSTTRGERGRARVRRGCATRRARSSRSHARPTGSGSSPPTAACAAARARRCSRSSSALDAARRTRVTCRSRCAAPPRPCRGAASRRASSPWPPTGSAAPGRALGARRTCPLALLVPGGAPPRNRAVLAARRRTRAVDAARRRHAPASTPPTRWATACCIGDAHACARRRRARRAASLLRVAPPERGWQALRVELEPDDFAADDARYSAVWIGPPPGVAVRPVRRALRRHRARARSSRDGARRARGATCASPSADAVERAARAPHCRPPIRCDSARRTVRSRGSASRGASVRAMQRCAARSRAAAALDGVAVSRRGYALVREGAGAVRHAGDGGRASPGSSPGPDYVLVGSRARSRRDRPARARRLRALARRHASACGSARRRATSARPIERACPARRRQLARAALDASRVPTGTRRSVGGGACDRARRARRLVRRCAARRRIGALVVNAPPEESRLAR